MLSLEFVFVAISVLALSVAGLVELNVGSLTVELNILRLLLVANNDGILEVNVDNDDQLVCAGLEEKVANVGKQNVNPLLCIERRLVSDTVLVNLDLSGYSFAFQGWTDIDVVQNSRSAIWGKKRKKEKGSLERTLLG